MNIRMTEYAIASLFRRKGKNLFIFIVFTVLTAAAGSIFTISSAMQKEAMYSVDNLPDIVVQKYAGGRQQYIDINTASEIITLPGVTYAYPRVWGYYFFEYLNTNLTVVGLDIFNPENSATAQKILKDINPETFLKESMITGKDFRETVRSIYNKDEFSFQKPDGGYVTLRISDISDIGSGLISSSAVITNEDSAREILGIGQGFAADIAVNTANDQEISTISEKIKNRYPSVRTVTKEEIKASYQNMFDFKGGLFLLFMLSALLSFFMIIFDRLTGISGEEIKEIAVLKAVGWNTGDVMKIKFAEAFAVALPAFLLGLLLSLVYVYQLRGFGLQNIFFGYSYIRPHFDLVYSFDIKPFITVFFIIFPVYTAAVILPAWRASVRDPGGVLR